MYTGMSMVRKAIDALNRAPKKWFLVDGIGAALSALLAGAVLVNFEVFLGLPSSALLKLAIAACLIVIYDIHHLLRKDLSPRLLRQRLRVLVSMNAAYVVLSLAFAYNHRQTLTAAGWGYILLEGLVVMSLAVMECKAAVLTH